MVKTSVKTANTDFWKTAGLKREIQITRTTMPGEHSTAIHSEILELGEEK